MKKLKFYLSVAAYYLVAALYFVLGHIAVGLHKWWKPIIAIASIPLCLWGLFSMFDKPFWPLFIFFALLILSVIAYAINNAKELKDHYSSGVEAKEKEQERLREHLAKMKRDRDLAREPIENALYATGKFTTCQCTELANGIFQYLKEAGFSVIRTER